MLITSIQSQIKSKIESAIKLDPELAFEKCANRNIREAWQHLKVVLVGLDRLIQLEVAQKQALKEPYPDGAKSELELIAGSITRNLIDARNLLSKEVADGSNLNVENPTFKPNIRKEDLNSLTELLPIFKFCNDLISQHIYPLLNVIQKAFYSSYPIRENDELRKTIIFQGLNDNTYQVKVFSQAGQHTLPNQDYLYIPSEIGQEKKLAKILLMGLDGTYGDIAAANEDTGRMIARGLPPLINNEFNKRIPQTGEISNSDLENIFKESISSAVQEYIKVMKKVLPLDHYKKLSIDLRAATNFVALLETKNQYMISCLGDFASGIFIDGNLKFDKEFYDSSTSQFQITVDLSNDKIDINDGMIKFQHISKNELSSGSYFLAFSDGLCDKFDANYRFHELFDSLEGTNNANEAVEKTVAFSKQHNNNDDKLVISVQLKS